MGGRQYDTIKTEIEEYRRISIGKGYFGILFKNTEKNLWHIALENCGAIIWTDKNKEDGIKKVKDDVETGNPQIMREQIEKAKNEIQSALLLSNSDFFRKFKS
jgi:hypothetical protein